MKSWLKENWFKIIVLILLGLFLWFYRFSYIPRDGAGYFKCDRLTGDCISPLTLPPLNFWD